MTLDVEVSTLIRRPPAYVGEVVVLESDRDGGTCMAVRHTGGPRGAAALASPLLARSLRRAAAADLAVLTRLLEDGR